MTEDGVIDWSLLTAVISSEEAKARAAAEEQQHQLLLLRGQGQAAAQCSATPATSAGAPILENAGCGGGAVVEVNSGGKVFFCFFKRPQRPSSPPVSPAQNGDASAAADQDACAADQQPLGAAVIKFAPSRLVMQAEQFANELCRHLDVAAPDCRIIRSSGATADEWSALSAAAERLAGTSAESGQDPQQKQEQQQQQAGSASPHAGGSAACAEELVCQLQGSPCLLLMEFIRGPQLLEADAAFTPGPILLTTVHDVGRLLLLDCVLGNADRLPCRRLGWRGNAGNCLFASSGTRYSSRLVAIDCVVRRRPPGNKLAAEDRAVDELAQVLLNDDAVAAEVLDDLLGSNAAARAALCGPQRGAAVAACQHGFRLCLRRTLAVKGLLEMIHQTLADSVKEAVSFIQAHMPDAAASGAPLDALGALAQAHGVTAGGGLWLQSQRRRPQATEPAATTAAAVTDAATAAPSRTSSSMAGRRAASLVAEGPTPTSNRSRSKSASSASDGTTPCSSASTATACKTSQAAQQKQRLQPCAEHSPAASTPLSAGSAAGSPAASTTTSALLSSSSRNSLGRALSAGGSKASGSSVVGAPPAEGLSRRRSAGNIPSLPAASVHRPTSARSLGASGGKDLARRRTLSDGGCAGFPGASSGGLVGAGGAAGASCVVPRTPHDATRAGSVATAVKNRDELNMTVQLRSIKTKAAHDEQLRCALSSMSAVLRERNASLVAAIQGWQERNRLERVLTTGFLDGQSPITDSYELAVRLQHMLARLQVLQTAAAAVAPWKLLPGLFLGSAVVADAHHLLRHLGITHVLNATHELLPPPPEAGFVVLQLPLRDVDDQAIAPQFDTVLDFVTAAQAAGGSVLVHCSEGKSRSVTLVTAFLMKSEGMTLQAALEHVRSVRPEASPNAGFMQALVALDKQLHGGRCSLSAETVAGLLKKVKPTAAVCELCGKAVGVSRASLAHHKKRCAAGGS